MLSSIKFGFSISCFIFVANLATVAPSKILWSAEMLKLIASAGKNTPLPSSYFAKV